MACLFQIRLNSLLSLWYCLCSVLLQAWLLFLGFERYRLYTEMQWPTGAYPRLWLTVYVSLLAACIPLLALFLATGLLKLGNLASDNEQLGARPRRTIQLIKGGTGQSAVRQRRSLSYRLCHCLRSGWTHGPPVAQCLHLLLALVQLFAQQCMLAQLYRFGFINSGDFLNSELDFLFQRARQLATNLPMGETRLQSFRITSEELAASPLAPNLLPILMHARLFGIPLEFANLLLALVAFCATYPAVFWRASRAFSLLFSLFLAVHSASIVWTYLGFSLLFRIQETNFYSPRPVGMGQHLWALRSLPLFHPMALVAAFWLVLALMQLAPVALYVFGYSKFVASQARLRRCRRVGSSPPLGEVDCSSADNGRALFCDRLSPHVFAVTLLLLVAAAKAPAFYAIGLLYYKEERPFLLCCVMADLVYMFVWMLLWCVLILKCQWHFHVHYDVQELISLQDAHKTAEAGQEEHRWRSPAELKNALLLVHGENLFLTDDPVAKPAIVRQVLRSCTAQHEQLPHWLRSVATAAHHQPAASTSMPGTQSPQRRVLQQNGPSSYGGMMMVGQRTPDLSHQLRRGLQTMQQMQEQQQRESPSDVPLAAPPYQRMASLPPLIDSSNGQPTAAMMAATNSFGTLQPRTRNAGGNEYAAFAGTRHLQQQQQMTPCGTLTRSFNASQQQQPASSIGHHQNMMVMPPFCSAESYATIHRRCSKSSVGSSAAAGFPGGAPVVAASPQLMQRANRAASLAAPTRNGSQHNGGGVSGAPNGHQQMPPMNGTSTLQEAAKMPREGQSMSIRGDDQSSLIHHHQSELLMNSSHQLPTMMLARHQQQQQGCYDEPAAITNNGGGGGRVYEQQRGVGPQRLPLLNGNGSAKEAASKQHGGQGSFGQAQNGVWHQPADALLEATRAPLASLNGTTSSGSLTVGSSRVGSAASSTSQATFEAPNGGTSVGGGFFNSFGQPGGGCDYGTLTRQNAKEIGELTLKTQQQRSGQQWKPSGPGNRMAADTEFATSVV